MAGCHEDRECVESRSLSGRILAFHTLDHPFGLARARVQSAAPRARWTPGRVKPILEAAELEKLAEYSIGLESLVKSARGPVLGGPFRRVKN